MHSEDVFEMDSEKKRISDRTMHLIGSGLVAGILILNVSFILTLFFNAAYSNLLGSEKSIMVFGFVSASIDAIAGGLVIAQLKDNNEAAIKGNEVNISGFYNQFIAYWKEWGMVFIDHPELRKYFYDNAPIDTDSEDYSLAMAVATYMDDLFVYSKTEVERLMTNFDIMPQQQYDSYIEYMKWMRSSNVYKLYLKQYGSNINRYEEYRGKTEGGAY